MILVCNCMSAMNCIAMLPHIIAFSFLVPALQSVEIHYCFKSGATGCDFKFGGNSSHTESIRLNISAYINTALRIKCSSNQPIRLIPKLENFRVRDMPPSYITSSVVALSALKEADSSGFVQIITNGLSTYYQLLDIQIHHTSAVEGLFKCQSYKDEETANDTTKRAQLFISLAKNFNPFWNTISLMRPYRPGLEDQVYETVPCRAFGLNSATLKTFKLHKRRRSMLLMNYYLPPDQNGHQVRREIREGCFEDVGKTLKALNDLGGESEADKKSFLQKNWLGTDCNYDGLLTCTDALIFTYSKISKLCGSKSLGPLMLNAGLSLQTALMRTILNGGDTQLVNAYYNPTQGFVLEEPIDYQSEYICSYEYQSSYIPSAVYMPARTGMNALVQLGQDFSENNARTLFCEFAGNASYKTVSFKFVLYDCNSLTTCDAIFSQATDKAEVNEEDNQIARLKMVSTEGIRRLQMKSSFTSGMLACTNVAVYAPENNLEYFEALDHIFTGLDGNPYFISENSYSNNALIQLELAADGNLVAGESYEFKCSISTFVLYANVTFELIYEDNSTLELAKASGIELWRVSLDTTLSSESQIATVTLNLKCNEKHKGLICRAPFIHKAELVESMLNFTVRPDDYAPSLTGEETAGIVVVAVVLFIMTFALIYLVYQYKINSKIVRKLTVEEVEEFQNGDRNVSPDEPDGAVNVKGLGFPVDLQIAQAELYLDEKKILGEGEYGRCIRGRFKSQDVAVKMNKCSDVSVFKDFLNELKIMAYVGVHENVVQFLGAVVEDIQKGVCYAVVELSPYGNLLELLRKSASQGGSNPGTARSIRGTPTTDLETVQLLRFCRQIATGMEFLASKKVIHGDLAARNILVFHHLTAKISDFGLSRKIDGTEYLKKSKQAVPWRWMAIESLEYLRFSHQSDMWSFGVTLWEIFSYGRVPFSGVSWTTDFVNDLKRGLRPDRPYNASDEIYQFMKKCWRLEMASRPSFPNAVAFFDREILMLAEHSYANLPVAAEED